MRKRSARCPPGPVRPTRMSRADRAYWEAVWHTYRPDIYRAAFMILFNPEDAEDVCQQTMLRLFPHIDLLRPMPEKQRAAYIVRTARHTALNLLRSREPEVFLEDDPDSAAYPETAPDEAYRSIQVSSIQKALSALHDRDRLLLQWKLFEGWKDDEIAAAMECAPASVHILVYRAKQRLKEKLKGDIWFDE